MGKLLASTENAAAQDGTGSKESAQSSQGVLRLFEHRFWRAAVQTLRREILLILGACGTGGGRAGGSQESERPRHERVREETGDDQR